MENNHGNSSDNRSHTFVAIISVIVGLYLTWLGNRHIQLTVTAGPAGWMNNVTGYWPIISAVLGVSLLVSGITGLLRGKEL